MDFKMEKYPHLNNLEKSSEVFSYNCVILEKIHGSNLRFGYDSEKGILIGSRNRIVYNESNNAEQLGNTHYDSVPLLLEDLDLWDEIKSRYPDHMFYGEVYGNGVQKGIRYCNDKRIVIFDIKDDSDSWLPWDDVVRICKNVGLETVPELYRGKVTPEWLNENIDNISVHINNGLSTEVIWTTNTSNDYNTTYNATSVSPRYLIITAYGFNNAVGPIINITDSIQLRLAKAAGQPM